jgi:hypothetical protein
MVVVQPGLQADIAGHIGGEQIADVLSGGVCNGFQVHKTTIDAASLLTRAPVSFMNRGCSTRREQ